MLTRRVFSAVLLPFVATSPIFAAEKAAYTPAAFAAAQAEGAPILVDINASWCPTCRAQQPILDRLEAAPKFKRLKVFVVDFDSQKDIVRQFGARAQSTLIVFKGEQEMGRSVGDTDAGSIAALLDAAL